MYTTNIQKTLQPANTGVEYTYIIVQILDDSQLYFLKYIQGWNWPGAVRSCDPKFFTKAELELRQLFEPAKAKVVETT